jgi:hypothetical protein
VTRDPQFLTILSHSSSSSFLIFRVFGFFVTFLSDAAISMLRESVAINFLPGSPLSSLIVV